jgi:hypothetical protein
MPRSIQGAGRPALKKTCQILQFLVRSNSLNIMGKIQKIRDKKSLRRQLPKCALYRGGGFP